MQLEMESRGRGTTTPAFQVETAVLEADNFLDLGHGGRHGHRVQWRPLCGYPIHHHGVVGVTWL